jgi:uncharacterized protein
VSNYQWLPQKAWTGKTAVVVGASSGLGRNLVDALAEQSVAQVVLVARDSHRLANVVSELASKWQTVKFSQCAADVTTSTGCSILTEHIQSLEDRVDLLINAQGLSDRGTVMKLTSERLDELMRANVHGPLRTIQIIAPGMAQGGVIINIGSLSSYFAPRFLGGYSMAKHALRALTQQARLELKDQGLHVMLVCPGPIVSSQRVAREMASPDSAGGTRYAHLATASDIPAEALGSGGGAKIRGLDPVKLSADILQAAAQRRLELIRPRKARWLIWLMTLCPSWGESLLKRMTS